MRISPIALTATRQLSCLVVILAVISIAASVRAQVRISEVLPDPDPSSLHNEAYIELANQSDEWQDVSGWALQASSLRAVFPNATRIGPRRFLLLDLGSGAILRNFPPEYGTTLLSSSCVQSGALESDDVLNLIDAAGQVVSAVGWGDPLFRPSNVMILERDWASGFGSTCFALRYPLDGADDWVHTHECSPGYLIARARPSMVVGTVSVRGGGRITTATLSINGDKVSVDRFGGFAFFRVAPGRHELLVKAPGYFGRRVVVQKEHHRREVVHIDLWPIQADQALTIGPAGGTIEGPGYQVVIPEGFLSENRTINVQLLPPAAGDLPIEHYDLPLLVGHSLRVWPPLMSANGDSATISIQGASIYDGQLNARSTSYIAGDAQLIAAGVSSSANLVTFSSETLDDRMRLVVQEADGGLLADTGLKLWFVRSLRTTMDRNQDGFVDYLDADPDEFNLCPGQSFAATTSVSVAVTEIEATETSRAATRRRVREAGLELGTGKLTKWFVDGKATGKSIWDDAVTTGSGQTITNRNTRIFRSTVAETFVYSGQSPLRQFWWIWPDFRVFYLYFVPKEWDIAQVRTWKVSPEDLARADVKVLVPVGFSTVHENGESCTLSTGGATGGLPPGPSGNTGGQGGTTGPRGTTRNGRHTIDPRSPGEEGELSGESLEGRELHPVAEEPGGAAGSGG